MENKLQKLSPRKTLTATRLVALELKLPRNYKWIKRSPLNCTSTIANKKLDNYSSKIIKNQVDYQNFFKSNSLMKLVNWSIPQRIESNSPQGKTLNFIKDSIKSEAKLDKMNKKNTPDVNFFRQTLRLPMPMPSLHEEKIYNEKKKSESVIRQKKKFIQVGEKEIVEYRYSIRKSMTKSPLRMQFIY